MSDDKEERVDEPEDEADDKMERMYKMARPHLKKDKEEERED